MLILVLGFWSGILFFQLLPTLNLAGEIFCWLLEIFVICLLPNYFWLRRVARLCDVASFKKIVKHSVKFCLCFLLGFAWVWSVATWRANWSLPPALESQNIVVIGKISALPNIEDARANFELRTSRIAGAKVHTTLRLNWYGRYPELLIGDEWQLEVRLHAPRGSANPGGFDFERYLWQRGIRAVGYVVTQSPANRCLSVGGGVHYWLAQTRQKLRYEIESALLGKPLADVIVALVVGDQSLISQSKWQVLRDTGTSYLVAIAGLHISLVGGLAFFLVRFLWRRCVRLTLWIPAREAATVLGLVAALAYSLVSGFSIPTQRAFSMLVVFMLAVMLRRNVDAWRALGLAILVVLLFDPLAVLTVGFWLSFAAVIFIFYVTSGRLHLLGGFCRKYWRMQIAITLGLTPLTLLFFQQVAITTFIANIIALPGICSVVVPLSLLGSFALLFMPQLGVIVLLLAEKLAEWVWLWLSWLAQFPQFSWHHAIPCAWIFGTAIIGILLLLAPRGFPAKKLGVLWLCPLLFYISLAPPIGVAQITVLDVGEEVVAVVRTRAHVLIYGSGKSVGKSDVNETAIQPFLRTLGVPRVDARVSNDQSQSQSQNSLPPSWQWDGVTFNLLNPASNDQDAFPSVLQVRAQNGQQVLFADSLSYRAEKKLLVDAPNFLSSQILVVGSGADDFVPDAEFLRAVFPRYVLIATTGQARSYAKISRLTDSIREALGERVVTILTTAESGAVSFDLGGDAGRVEQYRIAHPHYWSSE